MTEPSMPTPADVPRFDPAPVWPHLPAWVREAIGRLALELCVARYGVEVAFTERRSDLMVGAEDVAMEALDAVVARHVVDTGLVSRADPGVPLVAGAICDTCGLAATDDFAALVGFSSPTRCWQCTAPDDGASPS